MKNDQRAWALLNGMRRRADTVKHVRDPGSRKSTEGRPLGPEPCPGETLPLSPMRIFAAGLLFFTKHQEVNKSSLSHAQATTDVR